MCFHSCGMTIVMVVISIPIPGTTAGAAQSPLLGSRHDIFFFRLYDLWLTHDCWQGFYNYSVHNDEPMSGIDRPSLVRASPLATAGHQVYKQQLHTSKPIPILSAKSLRIATQTGLRKMCELAKTRLKV